MKILSIDTSCDETAASVTEGTTVLSNVIWSQASLHAKFGGVYPSLAQRHHEERIDWVIEKALKTAFPGKGKSTKYQSLITNNITAIAVTFGPGLAIALGVGIDKAKELAKNFNKPLIPINHVEAHLLSPLAKPRTEISSHLPPSPHNKQKSLSTANYQLTTFPAFGLVLSGKNTEFVLMENIGKYQILADVADDALGEALDKSARLLGFGYPGGAILEKFAKKGDSYEYELPIPLREEKIKNRFSYSGLKTAFVRLLNAIGSPTPTQINDLAASFQKTAFDHIIKVLDYQITNNSSTVKHLMFGGGVSNNVEIRKRLRILCRKHNLKLHIPYSNKLTTDNAAMIGVCAYLKISHEKLNLKNYYDYNKIDRNPRAKIA